MSVVFGHIRWRLVGWSVLVLGTILVALGTVLYVGLSRSLMEAADANLVTSSQTAQAELQEAAEPGALERDGYQGGLFYIVVDGSGTIVANPQQVDTQSLPADLAVIPDPRFLTLDTPGGDVRIYARGVQQRTFGAVSLVVGQSLGPERAEEARLLMVLLLGGGLGLLLSCVGAWFLADRALVPIRRAFERQQEFVADASHELRTPLTILHSATDLLLHCLDQPLRANRELLDQLTLEIGRMERLTRDLLALARSDRGELQLACGQVDLGALATDLARRVAVLAERHGIEVQVQVEEPAPVVDGDPDRLLQIGLIVLDNALKHTPAGGHVRILISTQGQMGVLEIEDTGEGIPPEHLPRVFDRFYRVDRARSRASGGAGLGLAIAQELVTAHGGHITLTNRPDGGARGTVQLPLAAADPTPAEVDARGSLTSA